MQAARDITIEQHQTLEKLRRLVFLKRHSGLSAYEPHPKQELFHRAGNFKRRYLRTGNRFGKSTCGVAEDASWAVGARLWCEEGDPLRYLGIPKRSTKGLILCADWDKASEIFTNQAEGKAKGKLFKFLPTNSIKGIHKNQAGEIDCIDVESVHGGVSTIYLDTIRSFMSNPMGQESSNWDWIHVDEPIPKEMWEANARGLIDSGGSAWFTCTPITQQWINEMFIPRSRLREDFADGLIDERNSKWTLTGSTYDNALLDKTEIDRYANDLSPKDRAARLYGRPKSMAGVVYDEFSFERHVYTDLPKGWVDFDQPPENYTIRVAIDPHPATNHAVLFAATAPTGQTFFYQEFFAHPLMDDLCKAIWEMLKGRHPHAILLDPIAFNPDPLTGATWADTFYQNQLMVLPAPKSLTHGIVATNNALAKTTGPTLHFCSSLGETLYEFETYVWDSKKENKPVDKDDHMMECLYRLVISGLDYVPVEKQNSFKLSTPSFLTPDYTVPTLGNLSF